MLYLVQGVYECVGLLVWLPLSNYCFGRTSFLIGVLVKIDVALRSKIKRILTVLEWPLSWGRDITTVESGKLECVSVKCIG